ncbi:MAG: glycosyltransferase [bacterium]
MQHEKKEYALITAAKNEERFLEDTIKSVIMQSIRPAKWIIVDDNSIDRTGEILNEYAQKYRFIYSLKTIKREERNFAAKARALKIAINQIEIKNYKFIGVLDADITFDQEFYANLMQVFMMNPSYGLIGGVVWENFNGKWKYNHSNPDWSVGGATHFFRSDLFEKVRYYPELKYGGEDTVVEYMIRDMGYSVKAIKELRVFHHKPTRPEFGGALKRNYILGKQEYCWGSTLTFEIMKCVVRIKSKPYILGACARFGGYLCACIFLRRVGMVTPEIRKIIRRQQNGRLLSDLFSHFNHGCKLKSSSFITRNKGRL